MLMRFILLEKTSLWFFKISIFGAPVDIAGTGGHSWVIWVRH